MKPQPRRGSPLAGTLSPEQVAQRWGTTTKEVRRMLGRQEIGFVEIRGRIRIPLEEVQRYEEA